MMTSHSRSKLILVAVAAAFLTFCGGGGSGPSDDELADFIIGLTASDGSVAAARAGAPPAPTGGPGLTVTSSGSVTSGGNDIVRLRAASPFSKVYVDVSGTTGHYELALAAATTDITVIARLGSDIPDNSYLAGYRAQSPGGLVGTPSTVNNSVAAPPAAGSFNGTYTGSATGGDDPGDNPITFTVTNGVVGGVGVLSGTVSGSGAITCSFIDGNSCTATLTGQITLTSSGGATATGTWSHPTTPACGPANSGTWTATR